MLNEFTRMEMLVGDEGIRKLLCLAWAEWGLMWQKLLRAAAWDV